MLGCDRAAAAAAYDPAYLLPFALACLGGCQQQAPPHPGGSAAAGVAVDVPSFVQWGLLAVCLRSMASNDVPLRCEEV